MKIWCLEDEANIRELTIYTLKMSGYEVAGFSNGKEMFAALEHDCPDLLLLDWMLPGEDGYDILKRLRTLPTTEALPVIVASAKGMEYDKVMMLDLGADDYLVKPFGMMEMLSRVKAVLRRSTVSQLQDDTLLSTDGICLDTVKRTVTVDNKAVVLTYKEFELLRLFLKFKGRVFSREQLFQLVWGEAYVGESRTCDMHIRSLRQKLGTHGEQIETVRNVGYRLQE